ncbi:MAG: hypothetical protein M3275_06450 [Thermoproteota archaeon]|nr:hypothetical protein [Thermoproteota archaeon]
MFKVGQIRQQHPSGVTIIVILNIIVGIIMLLGGIAFIISGIGLSLVPPSAFENGNFADDSDVDDLSDISPSLIGGLIAIGSVMITIGIVSFIVAYGLLKRMRWSWTMTIILSIISIVLSVITTVGTVQALFWLGLGIILSPPVAPIDSSTPPPPFGAIISIIISGIIIYYVYRPNVKAYFGKAAARTDATPPAA